MNRDAEFDKKLKAELQQQRCYEAFQFSQSYIARKFTPDLATILMKRCLDALLLFIEYGDPANGGNLLCWFLEQSTYLKAVDNHQAAIFLSDISGILNEVESPSAGVLADIISTKILTFVASRVTDGELDVTSPFGRNAVRLMESLGDAFAKAGTWERASDMYIRASVMPKLASSLHGWGMLGLQSEYPLFFARAALTLLSKKKQYLAAELVKCSELYLSSMVDLSSSLGPAMATWHFSTMLTDLVGVVHTISFKERRNLYGLLIKKYESFLRRPDPRLYELAQTVSHQYGLNNPQAKSSDFVPKMRRNVSTKL